MTSPLKSGPFMLPNPAVVHLQMRKGEDNLAVGTGTLYRHGTDAYIVTAWHNVAGRHAETLKPLAKRSLRLPDNLIATIECLVDDGKGGILSTRMPFRIPLENDFETLYLVHSQGWPRVDVAAIPIDPCAAYPTDVRVSSGERRTFHSIMRRPAGDGGVATDIRFIQDFTGDPAQLSDEVARRLSVADDLFILGYPKGIVDQNVQPLWKRATVATQPDHGWNGQRTFLVDCASREGMSGAPVVSYVKSGALQINGIATLTRQPATFLHGVYVSRVGGGTLLEAQIGTVWRSTVIDEIIEAGVRGAHSSEVEAFPAEIREVIEKAWPADVLAFADRVLDPDRPLWFTHKIMEALNGRADPADIIEKIRQHARERLELAGAFPGAEDR